MGMQTTRYNKWPIPDIQTSVISLACHAEVVHLTSCLQRLHIATVHMADRAEGIFNYSPLSTLFSCRVSV